jgi:membrane protease YdiL (CAAX protease family)
LIPALLRRPFATPAGALRSGWKVLLFLVLSGATDRLFLALLPAGARESEIMERWVLTLACLLVSMLFLRAEERPLSSLGLRVDRRWGCHFLAGVLGGAAIIGLAALAIHLLGGFHLCRNPQAGPRDLAQGAWLYLAVGVQEELEYRGYPFQRLAEGAGPALSLLAFAVLFVLGHWNNPGMTGATRFWAALNIGLASILLGLCFLRTGSLALSMGVHLGWNWTQGTLLGFGVSGLEDPGWWKPLFHGKPAWLTGGSFGLEASLPCALLCGAACLVMSLWVPGKKNLLRKKIS